MSADAWARRDARRIHRRVLHIAGTADANDAEMVRYLRCQALFVLASPGEMPAGWAEDLRELIGLLDTQIDGAEAA